MAPEGGYFMWVTLPEGTDVNALHKAASDRGVAFVKGTDFLLEGGENTLRIAYSGVTPEQIDEGVARLARRRIARSDVLLGDHYAQRPQDGRSGRSQERCLPSTA